MYHKRFITFFLFLNVFFFCFPQSKIIRTLSLDFTRTVIFKDSSRDVIKGNIYYERNPYTFVFTTNYPADQTAWQNSEGTFFYEDDTIYDFYENDAVLSQTCTDFITWFDSDFGLTEQGYKPCENYLEDSRTVTVWNYTKTNAVPVHHILVSSLSDGKIDRLRMFSDETTCFADTTLLQFEKLNGFYFPAKIKTVSTNANGETYETFLTFSNLRINNAPENAFKYTKIDLEPAPSQNTETKGTDPSTLETKGTDPSTLRNAIFPTIGDRPSDFGNGPSFPPTGTDPSTAPAPKTYRVSIPSVLVGAGFKFYKKFITDQDMTNCPFTPSCSEYMLQAITQNGIPGFFQGLERLSRCTNFEHKRGFYEEDENHKHIDPLPPKKAKTKKEQS